MDRSKSFGPTDSVAGTKTTVGTADALLDRDVTIYKIRVGKGNVVNAKECAGVITVEAKGLDGTHQYAYGNGSGGATNSAQNIAAEEIDCSIPISGNSIVTVSVTDAEAAKDVEVSLQFKEGRGPDVRSYAVGGAGQDTTADTLLALTTAPVMEKGGLIKEIRFAGSGVVDAKAGSGRLELKIPGLSGPFEWAVGNGPGGATLGGAAHADVINLPNGIPVAKNVTVTINITTAEVMLSATCSIQVA